MHLTANLPGNLPVKKFVNRLRFDRIMVMSLWPVFWPTLYMVYVLYHRRNVPQCRPRVATVRMKYIHILT